MWAKRSHSLIKQSKFIAIDNNKANSNLKQQNTLLSINQDASSVYMTLLAYYMPSILSRLVYQLASSMKSIASGRYRIGSVLASGSFGKVYSDPPFAIKQIRLPSRSGHRAASSLSSIISNQISILTQLNHQHVVKLFQIVQESDCVYIVMELCEGDLRRYTESGPVGEVVACKLLRQMLRGYSQLVRLGVVHRDLKPANLLLRNGSLKIADFGMSKLQEGGQLLRSHVGTPYYMAPQVLQRIEYTRKCDVWSMGVIFYELLFGGLPWTGRSEEALLGAIMTQPLRVPASAGEWVKEMLEGMLAISEGRRLTWWEVEKLLDLRDGLEIGKEEKCFHWSVVRQMIKVEAERVAVVRFKVSYEGLTGEQKKEVNNQMGYLFREEEAYILNYLSM